jgi:hypothetical protein
MQGYHPMMVDLAEQLVYRWARLNPHESALPPRRISTTRQRAEPWCTCSDSLAGYQLRDDDAIDAIRALRAALPSFVTLEVGGLGLPVKVDRGFDRLVRGLAAAFSSWTEQPPTSRGRR